MTRVLVAGAGVAAVECVLALRALAGTRLDIELLAPAQELVYRPTSVRTPFGGDPAPRIDLRRLASDLDLRVHRAALESVEPETHHVVTRDGARLSYDLLVVATGARSREAVPGAVTFRGPMSAGAVEDVLATVAAAPGLRLAFTAPAGPRWLLPLYELALLSATALRERGVADPDLVVVTGEHEPLDLLGPAAARAVRSALEHEGVDLVTGATPEAAFEGVLALRGGELMRADAVVALPELVGPGIVGLPHDEAGFVPVDEHGRVRGCPDVFAAGDVTDHPVKHGGLAAQQADAVAEAIAARVGAIVDPAPFRPVLRGLLLTGDAPLYLRAELSPGGELANRALSTAGAVSPGALWWPPGKIAGRYLTPFVAAGGTAAPPLTDQPAASVVAGLDLLILAADQDAAAGDHQAAVKALDDAEAWLGPLPAGVGERREQWRRAIAPPT